ncbi:Prostaglandin E synthase 3 (Cytosolic) [Orbilia ellipsospora]|uniref:Prostaglandin E synthase 3 (Cytosolic) n=1 Tax=Orbilia ellipsospora TaxID=2528407 RepID=A0AAV9XH52_9PEZI
MPVLTPSVSWAQRSNATTPEKNILYLTIEVSDVAASDLTFNLTPTSLSYKSKTSKGQEYAVEIEFFAEIDPTESKYHHSSRATECVIRKKEPKEEYWTRLTKEKVKLHWLKTDFSKWADEDEQEGAAVEPEYDPNMMSQFGGGDDAGGFGGIDFSKLGGPQGLAGLGGGADLSGMGAPPDFGAGGLDDDSDDDEDMPDLEGEEKAVPSEPAAAPAATKGKSVIEELD